jgi:Txe/YoeB family toxin of Txe-Axe toxin-antitoxin module
LARLRLPGKESGHCAARPKANDVWQTRVDASYRFYFKIEGDTYQILSVARHPK